MPKRQLHREVFFANNGSGPYVCYECGRQLQFQETFVVHHKDENDQNNAPENLVAAHAGCHIRHHKTGWQPSKETLVKMSAASLGRKLSAAHLAALIKGNLGHTRSAEARARMSEAQMGRVITKEHRQKISETLRAKVTTEARQQFSLLGAMGAAARWHPVEKETS